MASLHSIFQDIADIISDESNIETLKHKIETNQLDWEKIVPVASSHLVIPLLYCKLKEKDLLEILPKDLNSYLEEITNQNRDRNKTILKEVKDISLLLNKHDIDHVFLKGVALMVSGSYKDIGERMIGDIDILVHPKQLFDAQNILLKHGYTAIETTFGQNFFEHKHLARLIPEKGLAAIEIHRKLLHKPVKNQLDTNRILKNKRSVNKITIPDFNDLLNHTILNFEINDYGYYYNYLGLRNTYDAIKLLKILPEKRLNRINQNKYFSSFVDKISVYFSLPIFIKKNRAVLSSGRIFRLKQKSSFIRNLIYKFLNIWQFGSVILNRFFMFLGNTDYRKEAINNRKRIQNLIHNKIKSFY